MYDLQHSLDLSCLLSLGMAAMEAEPQFDALFSSDLFLVRIYDTVEI